MCANTHIPPVVQRSASWVEELRRWPVQETNYRIVPAASMVISEQIAGAGHGSAPMVSNKRAKGNRNEFKKALGANAVELDNEEPAKVGDGRRLSSSRTVTLSGNAASCRKGIIGDYEQGLCRQCGAIVGGYMASGREDKLGRISPL